MKDYAFANDCYAALISVYPAEPQFHFEYARGLNKRPDPDGAIKHFKRSLVLSPSDPVVIKGFAHVLDGLGRLTESTRQYNTALFVNPEDKGARFASNSIALLNHSETTKNRTAGALTKILQQIRTK